MKSSPYAALVLGRTMPASSPARAVTAPTFRSLTGPSLRLPPIFPQSRSHPQWRIGSIRRVHLRRVRWLLSNLKILSQPGRVPRLTPTPLCLSDLINLRESKSIRSKVHSLFQMTICHLPMHHLQLSDGSGYWRTMRLETVQPCGRSKIPGRTKVSHWTTPALMIKIN